MNDTPNTQSAEQELADLKQEAALMGLKHSPNIGLDTLREKIRLHNEGLSSNIDEDDVEEAAAEPDEAPVVDDSKLTVTQRRIRAKREAMALVRIRVSNLNPAKKLIPGEFFSFSNKFVGIVKKYVPFGEQTDNGYHVPRCIYEMMKQRKFLQIKTRPNPKNSAETIIMQRWVPEFAIEVLPQLTQKDLDKLAAQQAAAEGLQEV